MSPGIFAHWPNRITGARFMGALVLFLIFSLARNLPEWNPADRAVGYLGVQMQICFWLFVLVACTDFVDGYLARRYDLVTPFGRIADPFVDKVLVIGAMIYLSVMEWSSPWFPPEVVVIVLARELLVTGLRGYVETMGIPFPADWSGKIKMILQCVAIGTVLGLHAFPWWGWAQTVLCYAGHIFVYATLAASVGSGVTYALRTRRLLTEASE